MCPIENRNFCTGEELSPNTFDLIEKKSLFGITSENIIQNLKAINESEAEIAIALHNELTTLENENRKNLSMSLKNSFDT